jgi:hypothetical protein
MTEQDAIQRVMQGDFSAAAQLSPEAREVLLEALEGVRQGTVGEGLLDVAYAARGGRPQITADIDDFLDTEEFMGRDFGDEFWPVWRDELRYVLDPANNINLWLIRGSMGGGKSYSGTAALVYKMYEVSNHEDPAREFGLASGTHIVFGLFNATKYLADDVNYSYLTLFLSRCNYFASIRDQIREADRKKRIRGNVLDLPKGLRIALASDQFMMLGKNLFGGILDEANWRDRILSAEEHDKIYGTFQATLRRIKTRFGDSRGGFPGLMVAVSSEREMSPTMDRLCEEYGSDPHTHITQFSIWDVKSQPGDDDNRFYVAIPQQGGIPPRVFEDRGEAEEYGDNLEILMVPRRFKADFEADIIGALNDLAGMRVDSGGNKVFYLPSRIADCEDANRANPIISETVVHGMSSTNELKDYFDTSAACVLADAIQQTYKPRYFPNATRVLHTDLSINNDATGIVCGCLGNPVIHKVGHELRTASLPEYVVHIDFLLRIKAPPGSKIDFSALRKFVVWLNQICGYHFGLLSWDGFESEDSVQTMTKKGFKTEKLSVDKKPGPYLTLRDVMQAVRLSMPPHEYVKVELENLRQTQKKRSNVKKIIIDHPKTMRLGGRLVPGSKDVADAMAAVAFHLVTKFATIHVAHEPAQVGPPKPKPQPQASVVEFLKQDKRMTMRELVEGKKKK